jgi:hypothetical protein
MTSSEEDTHNTKQSGKNYVIDLKAFSDSRVRLETELRNSYSSIEILDTYCTDGTKFNFVNPLVNPDGANPLLLELYKHDGDGNVKAPWGICEYTDEGRAFKDDMQGDGTVHVTKCEYGDDMESTSLPSPANIHFWPAKSWRNINAYYIKRNSEDIYSRANWKKLTKTVKKWLSRVHRIWSKIVGRLPSNGMHLTGGLEMSNGVQLYNFLLHRYGHTHAQCLASLLRILANIELLKPDPKTGDPETIRDYFDRATRIAREAKEFPAMRFPIVGPLLKVMILEGLNRSSSKYGQMVISAYANDLEDTIEHLQMTMETVEGLRNKQIMDEFAPTQLATGTVMVATGNPLDPHNNPNEPCDTEGHVGHLNSQCRTKWGHRATRYRGRGRGGGRGRGRGGRGRGLGGRGNNNCFIFTSGRTCPYGDSCKYEHDKPRAKAFVATNTYQQSGAEADSSAAVNVAEATRNPYGFVITHDDESSSSGNG